MVWTGRRLHGLDQALSELVGRGASTWSGPGAVGHGLDQALSGMVWTGRCLAWSGPGAV